MRVVSSRATLLIAAVAQLCRAARVSAHAFSASRLFAANDDDDDATTGVRCIRRAVVLSVCVCVRVRVCVLINYVRCGGSRGAFAAASGREFILNVVALRWRPEAAVCGCGCGTCAGSMQLNN